MTDTTIPDDLTVQDILDEANAVGYHTILEVWREILKPAEGELAKKIAPQWANRIVATYQGVGFADVADFRDLYFSKIIELARILDLEIEGDDECLKFTTAEEDVKFNSHHYINVLTDWQKTFLTWELDWDTTHPDAAIELAAISEVHKMFFEQTGILGLLEQIKFEFTDADRDALAAALEDLRASREE